MLDVERVREDFPILRRTVRGHPLVYLDNAATSQKPRAVLEALVEFYSRTNANIHRGIHTLSEEATALYEGTRQRVAHFIGAQKARTIIFTRNATEAINLVSHAWGLSRIGAGEEILLTEMEHHSNLVPWQLLAQARGATLRFIPVRGDGHLALEELPRLLGEKTRLVAMTLMSNVLGTINPVDVVIRAAHARGIPVLVDGAQGVPHLPVRVEELGCDFLAFSAHKMLGPTGVGVLYAKEHLLEEMEPFLGGGDMIRDVWLDHAVWNDLPWKFEAGTPNIADVIAFGKALEYLERLGMADVRLHEQGLAGYALERLQEVEGLKIHGPSDPKARGGVISFELGGLHPHDLGQILDEDGIAIRAGHHCCKPLMRKLGVVATARASFYIYNTREELDALVQGIRKAKEVFAVASQR